LTFYADLKRAAKRAIPDRRSAGGYFTAKQAASLGYAGNKRAYHVQAGNWLREHRGIYRLALFPEPDRSDLILWWLWSRNRSDQPSGIYSHQTALSLHELTDVNPSRRRGTARMLYVKGLSHWLRLSYGRGRMTTTAT
jgi:hypothetical protein